ncbi:hypothetical protein TB2_003291 [Malus domestica]
MEDNYKFSKASHYLDQDSVKKNQFMVPNKSFNSKASPTKLQLHSFTYKSFNTKASPTKPSPTKVSSMEDNYKFSKASHYLDQDSVKQNQFMVPNKSFNSKASPTKLQLQSFTYTSFNTKASPTKASSMEDNYKFSKASHYLDQDSVKQNQFMVPNKSFNSKASPTKLQLKSFTYKSFNTKVSPTKASTQKLDPQKLHL